MFHYEENQNLTHIRQQELSDEGERSRLAADGKPRTHRFGAVFTYALRKVTGLLPPSPAQPTLSEPPRPSMRKSRATR